MGQEERNCNLEIFECGTCPCVYVRARVCVCVDVLNLRVIYGKCCQHGISNAPQFEFKLLNGIIKIIMHVFQRV